MDDGADDDFDTLLARLAATPRQRPPLELIGLERFELRRRLGAGGFGDVYEARDREHGTVVALKALRAATPDWLYRFKREFRVVADLTHPNLVRLHELSCEGDRWYLTMELVDGLAIDEHVARAPDQLRSCFAQLALAIAALHRAGVVHRDLKPSNALVEATGRVVLLDFGLALEAAGPIATVVAGTPPFMAPELPGGAEPTPASDWYAFGVMLYAALAGRRPFPGSERDQQERKLRGDAPPPSTVRPGVDPDLDDLVMRLLRPAAGARPTGDEVLAALDVSAARRPTALPRHDDAGAIVGRERELDALDDALAATRDGRATVVTIDGPGGIGKSSLVAAFARRVRAHDVALYHGRCHEAESVPYKGLDGMIDLLGNDLARRGAAAIDALIPPGADALARMFPVLKRVEAFALAQRLARRARSPHEVRRAGADALRELLRRMGARAPLALFVDDVHWASDDTVRLLLELLAPPAPAALVMLAYRREAVGRSAGLDALLAGLAPRPDLARVELPLAPLDDTAIASLIAARGPGAGPPPEAVRDTGGHPYLLARLLDGDGDGDGDGAAAPRPDLAELLAAQLARLDAEAREVLDVVAIAGEPVGQLAAFAAAGVRRSPAIVDALRRERLVHTLAPAADAPIEAYHDRVREVALAAIGEARRRQLHHRLALALEGHGVAEPETLARHYREARDLAATVAWTRRAARHATASLAFARAAALYRDALALDLDDGPRLDLLEELADAQVMAGARGDAGAACLDAASLAAGRGDAGRAATLRARAGQHLLLGGLVDRGLGVIREALAAVDVALPDDPAIAVAHSFNLGAELVARGLGFARRDAADVPPRQLHRVDLALDVARALTLIDLRAPLMASRALRDALDAGVAPRIQLACALFVASSAARAPDHPLIVEAEAAAHALARELADGVAHAWAELATGFRGIQREDHVRAIAAFAEAERRFLAAGPGYAREASIARIAILVVCGNLGLDPPYAQRTQRRAADEARARGDVFAATWAELTHAWVQLAAGDPAAARADLARARATWPRSTDSLFGVTALMNEIAIALYEDAGAAWATAARVAPEFRALFSSMLPLPRALHARLAASCALAAHNAGLADRATTRARIAPLADELADLPYARAPRCVLGSHLRWLDGDVAGAAALLDEADAHWTGTRQRSQALAARLRAAQLRGDGDGARAAAAALRALAIADPDRFARLIAGPPPPA